MNKANNSLLMKEQNRYHVLRLIRSEALSRAELARKTGLTRAAVSIIVDKLISEGLVLEGEAVRSSSGRHPTSLYLNGDKYYSIGIDITRDGCTVALCSLASRIVKKQFVEYEGTREAALEKIYSVIEEYLSDNVLGIGVSSPGPLDIERGIILDVPKLEIFRGFNIKETLEEKFQLPVYLEKDTNALALQEKNCFLRDNFLYILADHGLGCAYIKDGVLFKGFDGLGCEIGHISLDMNGEKCSCGNTGCASLYTSVSSAVKKGGAENYAELCGLAKEGDAFSREALLYQGRMLAQVLLTAVNLFEPKEIVLGGELKQGVFILKEIIEKKLNECALSRYIHSVKVEASEIKDRALSPALLVLEKFFMKG